MGLSHLYGGWHEWATCSKSELKTTWMTETTVQRKDCSEKKQQNKTALAAPSFSHVYLQISIPWSVPEYSICRKGPFWRTWAQVNASLYKVLSAYSLSEDSMLSELAHLLSHCDPLEPQQEGREKTSGRFAKQNMLHLCPWELLTRHQFCSLEEATAFLLMPPPCSLHWNPKASSSSSWADKPQPSLSFCVSVCLLAWRDNKITQHSGML